MEDITTMTNNCEYQSNAAGFDLINRRVMRSFCGGRGRPNRPNVSF